MQSAGDLQARDTDGRWRPGASGNPRGRRRGSLNKSTQGLRAIADALLDRPGYWESVVSRIMAGDAPGLELYLWAMRFGKPRTEAAVELTDDPQTMRELGDEVAHRLAALAERLAPPTRLPGRTRPASRR